MGIIWDLWKTPGPSLPTPTPKGWTGACWSRVLEARLWDSSSSTSVGLNSGFMWESYGTSEKHQAHLSPPQLPKAELELVGTFESFPVIPMCSQSSEPSFWIPIPWLQVGTWKPVISGGLAGSPGQVHWAQVPMEPLLSKWSQECTVRGPRLSRFVPSSFLYNPPTGGGRG